MKSEQDLNFKSQCFTLFSHLSSKVYIIYLNGYEQVPQYYNNA